MYRFSECSSNVIVQCFSNIFDISFVHSYRIVCKGVAKREVLFDQLYLYQFFEGNREHHGHVRKYEFRFLIYTLWSSFLP